MTLSDLAKYSMTRSIDSRDSRCNT